MSLDPFAQLLADPRLEGLAQRSPSSAGVAQTVGAAARSESADPSTRPRDGAAGPPPRPALDPFARTLASTQWERLGVDTGARAGEKRSAVAEAPDAKPQAHRNWGKVKDLPEVDGGELSFDDFVDIVNPLHHLPLIGFAYRSLTDDTISPHSRVIGGILFGGVMGGLMAAANSVAKQETGEDLGGHALAALFGEDDPETVDPAQVFAEADKDHMTPFSALSTQLALLNQAEQDGMPLANSILFAGTPAGPTTAPAANAAEVAAAPFQRLAQAPRSPSVAPGPAPAPAVLPTEKPVTRGNAAVALQVAEAAAAPRITAPDQVARAASAGRTASDRTATTVPERQAQPAPVRAAPARSAPLPEDWRSNGLAPPAMDAIADIMMRNLDLYERATRGDRVAS